MFKVEDLRFKYPKNEKDVINGINFEIMSVLKGAPEAIGLVRSNDPDKGPLDDLRWGLCHRYDDSWQWQYIRRFETYFPKIV